MITATAMLSVECFVRQTSHIPKDRMADAFRRSITVDILEGSSSALEIKQDPAIAEPIAANKANLSSLFGVSR